MRMTREIVAAFFLAVLADAAFACGLCLSVQGNPLALPHPRAIEVAVATRTALDSGTLRLASAGGWDNRRTPSARDYLAEWSANRRIDAAANISIHILLIDTSDAAVIVGRGGRLILAPGGDVGDCVMVTTSVTLRAVLAGELSLRNALQNNLVVIEGKKDLAQLFAAR